MTTLENVLDRQFGVILLRDLTGSQSVGNEQDSRSITVLNLSTAPIYVHGAWIHTVPLAGNAQAFDSDLVGPSIVPPGKDLRVLDVSIWEVAIADWRNLEARLKRMQIAKATELRVAISTGERDHEFNVEVRGIENLHKLGENATFDAVKREFERLEPIGWT